MRGDWYGNQAQRRRQLQFPVRCSNMSLAFDGAGRFVGGQWRDELENAVWPVTAVASWL